MFGAWSREGARFPQGQRINYGQFYYTSGGPPIVLGARFTKDISGLEIEFDVSTNRGQSGSVTDETLYQSADDILLDPKQAFGVGAFATWPSRKFVIVSFGRDATITSQSYPQWRPFVISDYFDQYALIGDGETFTIDPIAPEDKPATFAVLSAPKSVSYCSDWQLSAQDSQGGGGRPLSFGWFVTVRPMLETHDYADLDDYVACDTNNGTEAQCPAWVSRLQDTLSRLPATQPFIKFVSKAQSFSQKGSCNVEATCAQGLHVCFDGTDGTGGTDVECDIKPGYLYTWRAVSYSWLWSPGVQTSVRTFTCGSSPVPRDLWINPREYITCPAMSLKNSDPTCYELLQNAPSCEPWASFTTKVSPKPMLELEILGPSEMKLPSPKLNLVLRGRVNTQSLLVCEFPDGAFSPADILRMKGVGSTEALTSTLSSKWRIIREPLPPPDTPPEACAQDDMPICSSDTSASNYCMEDLTGNPSHESLVLNLPENFFKPQNSYFATLTNGMQGKDDTICSSLKIFLDEEPLEVDLYMGIYADKDQPKESAMGGIKRAYNLGVDIGDVLSPTAVQEMRFYARVLNPRQPPTCAGCSIKYLFDWKCRYWQKDLYKYWEPSSFVDAPKSIVTDCSCPTGDAEHRTCIKSWGLGNDTEVLSPFTESSVKVEEVKFTGKFNFTFEFTVVVTEFVERSGFGLDIGRSASEDMRATIYNQFDSRFQSYLAHREINLDLVIDKSKRPSSVTVNNLVPYTPLIVKNYIRHGATDEYIEPEQIPMGEESPPFLCPGRLPEDVNGIDRMCWYQWVELVGTDLSDPTLSLYPPFQPLSASSNFGLRTGLMQADSSFVIRLNMIKSLDETSEEMMYSFWEQRVVINAIPRNGYIKIEPSCGFGILDDFTITAQDWNDDPEDLPLSYAFSYQRMGYEKHPTFFTEFSYSPQIVFKLPYAQAGFNCKGRMADGTISDGIKDSEFCKLLDVSVTVRNVNAAFIISSTTVDIWRPQFGSDNAFQRGGKLNEDQPEPAPGYEDCHGPHEDLGLINPLVFMGDRLTQGFAYGFTNKNQVKMDMVIRNAAIFYNNEKDQVDNLVGQKDPEYSDSFIFRKTVLENIFLKLLPDSLGMLPNTAEGMESLISALYETYGHPQGMEELCFSSTQNIENLIHVIESTLGYITKLKLVVRFGLISNLVTLADSCTECLIAGTPVLPEILRRVSTETNGPMSKQGAKQVRELSSELTEHRLQISWDFNTKFAEDLCGVTTFSKDEKTDEQTLIQGNRHSFAFRRAYPWTPNTGFELSTPEFVADGERKCGPIVVSVAEGIGNGKVDVCVAVFHYNPVKFDSAMSGSFTTDGESQRQYDVPWPLSTKLCPVRVTTHQAPRNSPDDRIFLKTTVKFDLSHETTLARNWFVPKAPDRYSTTEDHNPPAFNNFAYQDIFFSGICEEWGITSTGIGSWFEAREVNQTVQYNDAGIEINQAPFFAHESVDACLKMHLPSNAAREPIPEEIASGIVTCHFDPVDRNFASSLDATLSGLYGVVVERADCQGSFSKHESLASTLDFSIAQMDYARLNGESWPATRSVCDKCSKCGGYNNDCELGCDSKFPSRRKVDLCGTCGGACFGPETEIGKDVLTGEPVYGECSQSQCSDLILIFCAGERPRTTRYWFGRGLCNDPSAVRPPGICTNIIAGTCQDCKLTPGKCESCQKEVRSEQYAVDSQHLTIREDEPYTVPPNNLTLVSEQFALRTVVMHLCPINEACRRYIWESGKDLGKTPRCEDLLSIIPDCALQCGSEHDYFDNSIFCAAGDFELPRAGSTCQRVAGSAESAPGTFVPALDPDAPARIAGTLWRCTGTPLQINRALQGLIYTPPRLYTSGRPPQSYVFWRFTFDVVDPQAYRKDVNVTVLPVNSPPKVSGGATFKVQEDRPTILSPKTPGKPGLLTVAILDDAAYQLPHEISVALTVHPEVGSGSISIGGSRHPPLCPGCPPGSGGATMLDEHTCVCRNGAHWSEGVSPWYGPGHSLVVHASMRLMNQTVLPNLEYVSGPNLWRDYLLDFKDRIQVMVADNGYAQWNHSVRAHANFSPNLTDSNEVEITVDKENDPPVPVMPDSITIMQGERGRLIGGHFVDFDAIDFAEDPFSIIYDLGIEVEQGYVGLDMAAANCSIYFPPVVVLPTPLVSLNVDARNEYRTQAVTSTAGIFLDGSEVHHDNATLFFAR